MQGADGVSVLIVHYQMFPAGSSILAAGDADRQWVMNIGDVSFDSVTLLRTREASC
jgi:hypothetical protein